MALPELPSLRKLLGDAWIDAEVFSEKPTHLLGRWQKAKPDNPWVVKYAEALVTTILASEKIKFNPEVLAAKLKSENDFLPTIAEMEYAIKLGKHGFVVTLEPMAPKKGPDLRADFDGLSYFIEIRTVGFSKDEERRDLVTKEIFTELHKTPSGYEVILTVGKEYKPSTKELRDGIKAIIHCLSELKKKGANTGRLYFVSKVEGLLRFPDTVISEKYADIMERANFVAQFDSIGYDLPGTPAILAEPQEHPPKPSKDHERLRRILDDKRDQLPAGSRGILLLDVSELFMLSEFSIERALYGDLIVRYPLVTRPDEPVGEPDMSRNARGFFAHTSRVSAVVFQKRRVEGDKISIDSKVYPTNRANPDTIRLTLTELKRFGDLENREHLCAEKSADQKRVGGGAHSQ